MASLTGSKVAGFYEDLYFRVIALPSSINLGYKVVGSSVTIEVWNSYLIQKELISVTEVDVVGLTFTPPLPLPLDHPPLGSIFFTAKVEAISFNVSLYARYVFNYTSDIVTVEITGSPAHIWPYYPDWNNSVLERLEWMTEVHTSYDATEQTRQLRKYPRRYFEFLPTELAAKGIDSFIYSWGAVAVPVWTDGAYLTDTVSAGDLTLAVDTSNRDFKVGYSVIIFKSYTEYEVGGIAEILPSSIVLTTGLSNDWGKGTSVYPIMPGKLNTAISVKNINQRVSVPSVQVLYSALNTWDSVDSVTSYRGLPIFSYQHNWREGYQFNYTRKVQLVDYSVGQIWYDDESGIPYQKQTVSLLLIGKDAIASFRSWLYARKGRAIPIWVCSEKSDMVALPFAFDYATLDIQYIGYTKNIFANGVSPLVGRKDIRIRFKDGTVIDTRITGSTDLEDGTERLDLDYSIWSGPLLPENIVQVSYITLCRLDADAVELAWRSPEIVETTFSLVSKNYDV